MTTQDSKASASYNIITGAFGEPKEKKDYRLQARHLALTWPQCNMSKEDAYKYLNEKFKPYSLMISHELHEDGHDHLHGYMWMKHKTNFKDPHWADLGKFHGNYKAAHDKTGWQTYIMKDGDYIMNNDFIGQHWHGFRSEKADFEAWMKHNKAKTLRDPFPFTLPDGTEIKKPELSEKKCNWIIISEPGWGKTPWAQDTFEGKKVYSRTQECTYPFDDYNGEDIILYDDVTPKINEILQATNVYKIDTPVYGNTRYTKKYWPLKQRRVLIILCNKERKPCYMEDSAFLSRFNELYL